MSIKIFKDINKIGFLLAGYLDGDDFAQVVHDIEKLCCEQENVHVLFETDDLKSHDFGLNLRDFELYKSYRARLKKIAVVHGDGKAPFITSQFRAFNSTTIRVFGRQQIEEAHKWISK